MMASRIDQPTLAEQLGRASVEWPFIDTAETEHGLPAGLLYAVGSRETNLRNVRGDGGHGWGVWQRDDRYWPIHPGYLDNVWQQAVDAASLLAVNRRVLGDWPAAVAAYNAGLGGVRKALAEGRGVDYYTTGRDYSADVLARRSTIEFLREASMAWHPRAERRPLGTQTEPRMSAHNILCYHTMVGSLLGTDDYFDDGGYYGVESHFGVGGSSDGPRDGHIIQWQNTAFCADANLDGKPDVLSVETSDGGDPNRPWSPKQIDACVDIGIWVCRTYNIPPVLVPDTKPGRRGIAYHRQGCDHSSSYRPRGWPYDSWRVPGGVRWSGVLGKVCPGDVRIRQLVDIVIPRIKAGLNVGGGSAPPAAPSTPLLLSEDFMDRPFEPGNVKRNLTLTVPLKGEAKCQPIIKWFNVGGIPRTPKLTIHNIRFCDGGGNQRTVQGAAGEVKPGNPWWGGNDNWCVPKDGEVTLVVEYTYDCPTDEWGKPLADATIGWREN